MTRGPEDPHLNQALVHAPDRDVAPPAHVSAQILAAAHREAAAAPAPARKPAAGVPWWRQARAAGALASVFLAGFIGLLWRGEPPGPAVDEPAPVAMVATETPALDTPRAQGASPAPAAAPAVAAAAPKRARAAMASPTPSRAAERADARAAALQREEQANQERQVSNAQALAARQPAAGAAPAGKVAADNTVAPAAAPVAPPPSPAPLPARAARLAPLSAAVPQSAQIPAQPMETGLPAPAESDQVVWQPGAQGPALGTAELQQLATLTRGLWQKAPGGTPSTQASGATATTATNEAPATTTRPTGLWLRSGVPVGMLRLEPGVVWWCAAGQACLRAEVPPDALRSLVGKLPGER